MNCINKKELEFIKEILALWAQHSEWTLMAITSIIFDSPNEEVVINRLLRNPEDFYEVLEPFYGDIMASRFANLLTEHLVLAADLVNALKDNPEMVEDIRCRWYRNADEIARLLGLINPYWTCSKWRRMLFKHLRLAEAFATKLLNNQYEEYIMAYDIYEAEVMMMAEMMYEGMLKQFCCEFR